MLISIDSATATTKISLKRFFLQFFYSVWAIFTTVEPQLSNTSVVEQFESRTRNKNKNFMGFLEKSYYRLQINQKYKINLKNRTFLMLVCNYIKPLSSGPSICLSSRSFTYNSVKITHPSSLAFSTYNRYRISSSHFKFSKKRIKNILIKVILNHITRN